MDCENAHKKERQNLDSYQPLQVALLGVCKRKGVSLLPVEPYKYPIAWVTQLQRIMFLKAIMIMSSSIWASWGQRFQNKPISYKAKCCL